MEGRNKLKWLHISDLHGVQLKNSNKNVNQINSNLRSEFLSMVQSQKWKFDVIFITGDLMRQNQADNIPDVVKYVQSIAATAETKPDNIFIVPGNHDINTKMDINRNQLLAEIYLQDGEKIDDNTTINNKMFGNPDQICTNYFRMNPDHEKKLIESAFKDNAFLQLYKEICERDYEQSACFTLERENVRVVHLNTCLYYSDKFNSNNSSPLINCDSLEAQLQQKITSTDKLNFIIAHHNIKSLYPIQQNRLRDILKKSHIDYYLYGHVHFPQGKILLSRGRSKIYEVGAGIGVQGFNVLPGFNIGEYIPAESAAFVKFYSFHTGYDEWKEDYWAPMNEFDQGKPTNVLTCSETNKHMDEREFEDIIRVQTESWRCLSPTANYFSYRLSELKRILQNTVPGFNTIKLGPSTDINQLIPTDKDQNLVMDNEKATLLRLLIEWAVINHFTEKTIEALNNNQLERDVAFNVLYDLYGRQYKSYVQNGIYIDPTARIEGFIWCSLKSNVFIGPNVTIEKECKIGLDVNIGGSDRNINSSIIGIINSIKNCCIPNTLGVRIEKNVSIGNGIWIMEGHNIGRNCIIGEYSKVISDIVIDFDINNNKHVTLYENILSMRDKSENNIPKILSVYPDHESRTIKVVSNVDNGIKAKIGIFEKGCSPQYVEIESDSRKLETGCTEFMFSFSFKPNDLYNKKLSFVLETDTHQHIYMVMFPHMYDMVG